jgi:hypothetical protein
LSLVGEATKHGPFIQDVTGTAFALYARWSTQAVDDHVDCGLPILYLLLNEQAAPCRLESQRPCASIARLKLTAIDPLLATRLDLIFQDVTGTALALSARSPTRAVGDHVDEAKPCPHRPE